MSKPRNKDLTPVMRQGAVLDAAGLKLDQISRVLDVGTGTVAKWRRNEEYRSLKKEYAERYDEQLMPVITRARSEFIEAFVKSLKTINEAQDAELKSGGPAWNTRLQAVQTLFTSMKHIFPDPASTKKDDGEGGGGGGPQAAVIVVNQDKDSNAEVVDSVVEELSDGGE